jgi:hypothetical protein
MQPGQGPGALATRPPLWRAFALDQGVNLCSRQRLSLDQFQRYRVNSGPNVRSAQGFQHPETKPVYPSGCLGGRVKTIGNFPRREFVSVGLLLPTPGIKRFGQGTRKGTADARGPILACRLNIPVRIPRVYVGWWFHLAQIHVTSELRIRNDGYPPKRNTHQDGNNCMTSFMHGGSFQFSLSVGFDHEMILANSPDSCQALFCLRNMLFCGKL